MRASILGLSLVIAIAAPAFADDKAAKAKAKKLYDEGLKHYNLAEYPEAIKSWKEAYLLSKRPLLLFNLGQAYRLSGDCKQAMTFYDSYQREEPSPKNQDELDQALGLCKDAKPVDKPDVEKASIDKRPVDKPPTVSEKPPVADKPVADKPVADKPEVANAEEPVDEPEDETPSTGGGGTLRKVGIGVGAAGAILGGVGIYFALDSKSAASDLDGYMGEWGQTQIDLEARGKSSATRAWIFGGAGLAGIAVGALMFAIGGPKQVEASTVTVVPTRGGAQVGWSYRF